MIDFYEELNLNQEDSIENIKRTLNQLESTWKRREINNPEKATKMLAIILEARDAFETEASKAEYDCNLAESRKVPEQVDYDAQRREKFMDYCVQAEDYYNDDQYDLAYEAIKRASQYRDPSVKDELDAIYSDLSSRIKYFMGDLNGALSDITEAIVTDPNKAKYSVWKGAILADCFNAAMDNPNNFQTARSYLAQSRLNLEKGFKLAQQNGDTLYQKIASIHLADSYSLIYDSDYQRAEYYANKALDLGASASELQSILESIKAGKDTGFQSYQGKSHPSEQREACYIATAVYGSYDCPEVWTLRRYRDYYLATSISGRLFIRIYYALSPTVIKLFGKTNWFNRGWKAILDKLVTRLQENGYSSDRYSDK